MRSPIRVVGIQPRWSFRNQSPESCRGTNRARGLPYRVLQQPYLQRLQKQVLRLGVETMATIIYGRQSDAANSHEYLKAALAAFETCLLSPTLSGQLSAWLEEVQKTWEEVSA